MGIIRGKLSSNNEVVPKNLEFNGPPLFRKCRCGCDTWFDKHGEQVTVVYLNDLLTKGVCLGSKQGKEKTMEDTKQEEEVQASVTVEELDTMVADRFAKKAEVEAKEDEKKALNKELMAIEARISAALVELQRDNYKTEDGSVRLQEEWFVSVPKVQEERELLFGWLKTHGIFEKYITVNGTSLKSLFKAERQAALDRGEDMMTWNIPGLGDARMHRVLRGTKGKKK